MSSVSSDATRLSPVSNSNDDSDNVSSAVMTKHDDSTVIPLKTDNTITPYPDSVQSWKYWSQNLEDLQIHIRHNDHKSSADTPFVFFKVPMLDAASVPKVDLVSHAKALEVHKLFCFLKILFHTRTLNFVFRAVQFQHAPSLYVEPATNPASSMALQSCYLSVGILLKSTQFYLLPIEDKDHITLFPQRIPVELRSNSWYIHRNYSLNQTGLCLIALNPWVSFMEAPKLNACIRFTLQLGSLRLLLFTHHNSLLLIKTFG